MAFSGMSSKEKTIVAILGVVILIALVGIGVLIARLVAGTGAGGGAAEITVVPTALGAQATPQATITLVSSPSLNAAGVSTPEPVSKTPTVVSRMSSPGPGFPVIIADQALSPGRRYRLEVSAEDGSKVAIQGSWGQAATSASGQMASPQIEFFQGTTPFSVDLTSPVSDPTLWSCSISAGPKDVLGTPPTLVITIYDVTGAQ